MRKLHLLIPFTVALLLGMAAWAVTETGSSLGALANKIIKIDRGLVKVEKACIECHLRETPSIVIDWKNSMHGRASVTCGDCHVAHKQDLDAFQCQGLRGTGVYISAIPTPRDCSRCHPVEVEQFGKSDHAGSYDSIKKLEAMSIKWEGKGSRAAEASGCVQCHGGIVEFTDGRPGGLHYPQEGVGRVNPDGSKGNCVVCHTRHRFNIVEARKAENCGACHLGPDHPQIEIWRESKHGKRAMTDGDQWVWDSAPDAWEPGDYSAPTCAVCHMSGIGELTTSHNISERLSWQAERPLSVRTDNWKDERAKMKSVCRNCHGPSWIDGFYAQYDAVIKLYNEQYYLPAKKMLDELYAADKITKDNPWDDEIELVFYHLWHHEGRRARMGTAMMGQDYAHWHGFFELAQDLDKITKLYRELMAE